MASGLEEGASLPAEDYETLIATTDVELLKRAWRHEKAAPEILPFQAPLVLRIREQIQLMVLPLNLNLNNALFGFREKKMNLTLLYRCCGISCQMCSVEFNSCFKFLKFLLFVLNISASLGMKQGAVYSGFGFFCL